VFPTLPALGIALAACGTDFDRYGLEIDGRIERSATAGLQLTFEGAPFDRADVSWSALPDSMVAFPTGDSARFLHAGAVTLTAETGEERVDFALTVPPPPAIVFDLLRGGNRDIWLAALDGRDAVRLTTDPADDSDPTAVGSTVIFVSYRDGNGELYATTVAGGPAERLTVTDVSELAPALSYDAARVAYTRSDGGVPKLWVAASAGGGAARVTGSFGFPGSIEAGPSWHPDDDRIAFVSTHLGSADLFVHTRSTAAFAVLVPDSADRAEVEPAWSPDGALLAFATDRPGDTELYLMKTATGALARATTRTGSDGQPGWTADGRLVYVAWEDGIPGLHWLDPAEPGSVHEIPVGAGEPRHPSGVFIRRTP
jgi:Tol biopolymer transport system component